MRLCKDHLVRFLTLADVAETLNISSAQAYALVRSGDLRAIKVGGRGQAAAVGRRGGNGAGVHKGHG